MKKKTKINPFSTKGYFGPYGGRYVPEMLIPALDELEKAYKDAKKDKSFTNEYKKILKDYSGRPTPLYFAENLTKHLKGAKIYLKQEGLGQTGSHKINNAIGQALLAKRMGKKRLIAETGAGQHGLATATVAAKFGFECEIFMGSVDIKRQRPNVFWMEQLGAKLTPVTTGSKTLKDAVNESLRNWIETLGTTHYLIGSVLGPHPYPVIVRNFQSVIGKEVIAQIKQAEGRLPDHLIACVGGGSNSMGLFYPFLKYDNVKMTGVEAGGLGLSTGMHAARFAKGKTGIIEGYKSLFLQNKEGQSLLTHSVAAGLDYIGVGPEHAYMNSIKKINYVSATDKEVIEALKLLVKTEGIIPALESSHALAECVKLAPKLEKNKIIVVNVSGRGDKDIFLVAEALKDKEWVEFLRSKVNEADLNE